MNMTLLELLKLIPKPILILAVGIIVVLTLVMLCQYLKMKGLEGIRNDVYGLILKAEHMYKESSQGKQKLEWVVSEARKLLPSYLKLVINETMLKMIINKWFQGVKDLLDDGKVNASSK